MKKLFTILVVLLFPSLVFAGPFLICDPYPTTSVQPTEFSLIVDGGSAIISPAVTVTGGVRLHYDLAGIPTGSHTVTVKAVRIDPVWGRLESATTPFSFVRPAAPAAPVGIGLAQ